MNGSIFKLTAVWVVRGWLMTSSCGVLAQQVIGSVTTSPQNGVEVLPITQVPAVGTLCLRACQLMRSDGLAINRLRANVLPVTDPLFLKQPKWFYIGLKKAGPQA